jgi:AraC-like DNA-binding protein
VVRYTPQTDARLGVETLSLAQLRQRGTAEHLQAVQRLEFLLLVLYTAGQGTHMVDFVHHPVQAGTLVVVQPGSLHRFPGLEGMDARLLVVDPQFMLPERLAVLTPLLAGKDWPVCSVLDEALVAEWLHITGQLQADLGRGGRADNLAALARQRLYTCLLLLHMHWDATQPLTLRHGPSVQLALRFRAQADLHHAAHWTVQAHARQLGCAERTLTRACQACFGRSAKAVLDERVLLEAQRLLVHGTESVDAIGHRLGFGDASQLVRFFRRLCGTTPQAFRRQVRAGPGP